MYSQRKIAKNYLNKATVAGVKVNLAFNTLLTVANSDYSNAGFTIRNTGSAGTLDVIEVVVTKIR